MKYGTMLAFLAGTAFGAIIAIVYDDSDNKNDKKKSKENDKPVSDVKSGDEFKESSTIDTYTPPKQDDIVAYTTVDPAESESPSEDPYEEIDKQHRRLPLLISETEYNSYGFETQDLYYDPEQRLLWQDGNEPFDADTVAIICGGLLEGAFDDGNRVVYIRNFRLTTDYAIYLSDI